jgi:hypothetical protein
MHAGQVNTAPCRSVTEDEVAHYRESGWVKLKSFVDDDVVRLLLATARAKMGVDGDSNDPYGLNQPFFNAEYGAGLFDPAMRALIEGIGQGARLLMNRKGTGIKYFTDFFAPKLPSASVTRNAGNGPTDFHQDFMTFGVDRTGGMTFWIALEDYDAVSGTMSFISGSHKLGILGGYHKGDVRDAYPELRELMTSDPISYKAGDVTVHSHTTAHGAGPNLTDRPRWAYLVLTQPADVCYNGGYSEAFDTSDLARDEPLPDDRFPVIG